MEKFKLCIKNNVGIVDKK